MSEYMNTGHAAFRGKLLVTVCTLALLTSVSIAGEAKAEDADRPVIWIDFGGQLEHMNDGEAKFAPKFLDKFAPLDLKPVLPEQDPLLYAIGEEARISFMPEGSDWVFSVAARNSRANSERILNQQLPKFAPIKGQYGPTHVTYYITQPIPIHLDSATRHEEKHLTIDFQAGKDVGFGLFSGKDASVVSLGVRFAQFTSARGASLTGVPNYFESGTDRKYGIFWSHYRYGGAMTASSSFRGVGPSLSWNASVPIAGHSDNGQITMDWGINGAVLFGHQKAHAVTSAHGAHYTRYAKTKIPPKVTHSSAATYDPPPTTFDRARRVTVPNLGGSIGLSYVYGDARISFGYRADMFFGAMDGGIATRKSEDTFFHGPYASISVGIGD